ncbi:hypothetical protein HMPREF0208_04969 [Citrobacter koseri]|uniref:Uncharacterized protein n=1 Tax=Citrobacter koseri (strain ATCC BAA-895 / CDC 4225-83 / SGSC4696) TaxID=290338 RepID=A8ALS2_CITK8|nr:hypothetical protein CKO_03352 [Citrobacter koseri ATCC BAA-895]KWZ95058.1 hypothetical protein HMPREF3220_04358 [Citrobacter koseri]KXA02382.1 hypothetical protein HMPREF3207_02538 [Citrobacter koseri]KXB39113.1 hypothetical protein HMPREF0208_04969 [Citrobacter koseri]
MYNLNQCKSAYPWISGKRRHSEDKAGKSQLKGGIFCIVLRLREGCSDLTGKKIS